MTNINDFDPDFLFANDFKDCKDGSVLFNMSYGDENNVPYIVFNNIECIFRKSGIFSYLIFCENTWNKNMLNDYVKVTNETEEEVSSFNDELEENDLFIMSKDFMRFKFKTDDKLVYNQEINIPSV